MYSWMSKPRSECWQHVKRDASPHKKTRKHQAPVRPRRYTWFSSFLRKYAKDIVARACKRMPDELIVYVSATKIKCAFLDKVNVIFIYPTTERMETNCIALEGTFLISGAMTLKKVCYIHLPSINKWSIVALVKFTLNEIMLFLPLMCFTNVEIELFY